MGYGHGSARPRRSSLSGVVTRRVLRISLGCVSSTPRPGASRPGWRVWKHSGTTHLAIGGDHNVRHAIEAAETAVDLYREAADDDRSTFDLLAARLDLAQGHLFAGDLDAAAVLLGSVLSSPPGQLSASIITRLGKFASQLGAAKYRGSPQVAALRERMKSTAEPIAAPAADLSEPPT